MDVREKSSNKKRLTDADAIIDFIDMGHYRNQLETCFSERDVVDMLESAPTVDAVEVVRCRECKHHYWEQEPCHGKSVHYCKLPHMRGVEVFKEFFCYYGERKEGANND